MNFKITDSPIHGLGVFAEQDIPAGTQVCLLCWWHEHEFWWRVTKRGFAKYLNHSYKNNCTQVLNELINQYIVETTVDIKEGEELTLNYDTCPEGVMKATSFDPPLV